MQDREKMMQNDKIMLFRRRKKEKKSSADKSMADILEENLNTVNRELARLEEARKRGEISEEEYFKLKMHLQSRKKDIEKMVP